MKSHDVTIHETKNRTYILLNGRKFLTINKDRQTVTDYFQNDIEVTQVLDNYFFAEFADSK